MLKSSVSLLNFITRSCRIFCILHEPSILYILINQYTNKMILIVLFTKNGLENIL